MVSCWFRGNKLKYVSNETHILTNILDIKNLYAAADSSEILKGINLTIKPGETHVIMGPNGSGKSTLANVLMANPSYKVDSGTILFKGEDILQWSTDQRAKAGMFLAFQHPEAIPGVPVHQFLRQAMSARKGFDLSVLEARLELADWLDKLEMPEEFAKRSLNEGFSGGERKRNEVLQMALLEPELAILDETDTGLDIDALKVVANGVNKVKQIHDDMAILVITHYQRLLKFLEPTKVHVLIGGKIVESGGNDLVEIIDKQGYDKWLN